MGPLIRSGKRLTDLIFVFFLFSTLAFSQGALVCTTTAVPVPVRAEGLTERTGDIILGCSGGTPGSVVSANLTLFLNVSITNRLMTGNNNDILLTVDTGPGPVPANVQAQQFAPMAVAFNGLSFTVPPSGKVTLRISNVRGAANQFGLPGQQPIIANLSFSNSAGLAVGNPQFIVGFTQRGLLATFSSSGVRCTGSPLPSTINLTNLFAIGTRFFSTRVTEGFADDFQKKDTFSDTGTRIVVRYSGFPAGARLFVPDAVAGSSATRPTAGGDLGVTASGGAYTPANSGSLLLARVSGADANGAGGTPVFTPGAAGSGTVAFDSDGEVSLANGSGLAVYEVVDSNPALQESAQFPTFVGITSIPSGAVVVAGQAVSLGPISTVARATATDPIPRFSPDPPPNDCSLLGDCGAAFFPNLLVDAPPLNFTAPAGGPFQVKYIRVNNQGGGLLNWTASLVLQNGSGWLTIDPPSGPNNATIRMDAHPEKLAPGTYQATLFVDAGPLAGSRTLPVTFVVTAPASASAPAPQPSITVTSVMNAASLQAGPLVAGSLATIRGTMLSGKTVSVTLDNLPATLLFKNDDQINLQVPEQLVSKTSAQLVVTVDGVRSAPQTVLLAASAPAIFANGILNQDSTVNSAANAADVGTILQIFATGLMSATSGPVTVQVNDRIVDTLYYAGPAPGRPGVQQVDFVVPDDLGGTSASVRLCANEGAAQRICSAPVTVTLK